MTGIHILLFPSSNPVKNSQYTDLSYIFFDAFSAYLKNSFKPELGNRAESLYTREN